MAKDILVLQNMEIIQKKDGDMAVAMLIRKKDWVAQFRNMVGIILTILF